jgi:hypothetical protein
VQFVHPGAAVRSRALVRHALRAYSLEVAIRATVWSIVLVWSFAVSVGRPGRPAGQEPAPPAPKPVTFTANVAPLLAARCQPCHFKGGKVYDRLPWDDYDAVRKAGAKLNTRLKGDDADLVTRWIKGGFAK